MTVLFSPKAEPVSAVAMSEAELSAQRNETAAPGVRASMPLSRTMPNQADDSRANDETTNKSHESSGVAIACRPLDGTVLTDTQMGEVSKEPSAKAELDKVFDAFSAANTMVEQALRNVIREKETLKAECEEGKKLLDYTLWKLSERTADFRALEYERDSTHASLKETEEMLNTARDYLKELQLKHWSVMSHNLQCQKQELEATKTAMKREADNQMAAFTSEKLQMRKKFEAKIPSIQKHLNDNIKAKEAAVLALAEEKAERKREKGNRRH